METKRMVARIWGWGLAGALAVGMTVCVPTIFFAQTCSGTPSARERREQMRLEQKERMRERVKRWQELEHQQRGGDQAEVRAILAVAARGSRAHRYQLEALPGYERRRTAGCPGAVSQVAEPQRRGQAPGPRTFPGIPESESGAGAGLAGKRQRWQSLPPEQRKEMREQFCRRPPRNPCGRQGVPMGGEEA
jgi:hypothetical protein